MLQSELDAAIRLAIAALIGIGVGVEREWSGHTTGPHARFAGLRTFLLLGLVGGASGLLAARGYEWIAVALITGASALAVAAFVVATTRAGAETDGTTEAAAIAVLALACLAGLGWLALAAGAGAIMLVALSEKERLHGLVRHLGDVELHAALQFAVLALVILPLLPDGPLFGALLIRPRMIWIVVLALSALNFAGFLARRVSAPHAGYSISGALGGLFSSTAVSLSFSRQSRSDDASAGPHLARGVVAACTVLVPRVLVVSALLSPMVAASLVPLLAPSFVIGVVIVLLGWRAEAPASAVAPAQSRSPLRLRSALEMAALFQLSLTAMAWVRPAFGTGGLYGMAALLGLTDVDALTVTMSSPSSAIPAATAARALAVGIVANTLVKTTIVTVIGRGPFRRSAALSLIGLAAATAAALILL
ncbi:MAG: DUF4010 domain-containing protein [Gemmatimonadaceae bacterium]